MDPSKYPYGGDHFVKLCPLWQLLLYYREIVGGENAIGTVMWLRLYAIRMNHN